MRDEPVDQVGAAFRGHPAEPANSQRVQIDRLAAVFRVRADQRVDDAVLGIVFAGGDPFRQIRRQAVFGIGMHGLQRTHIGAQRRR